jgi:RNA-directed DNA polymerase
VQEKLSVLLQDCLDEVNDAKQREDLIAHGFRRKRSIITNARQHRNRRYVFNIDLENFFPSINFGRVRGYFIRDKSFELDKDVATVIAQIACHENALPQGSPCSPPCDEEALYSSSSSSPVLAALAAATIFSACRPGTKS